MPIEWLKPDYPYSSDFGDRFYAEEDGLSESRYVFIEQNELQNGWKNTSRYLIGELGFGTGLNFLATVDAWMRQPNIGFLSYIAFEKYPLCHLDLEKALSAWPELERFKAELLKRYEVERIIEFPEWNMELRILSGDARESLAKLPPLSVNTWYCDGFTPKANPEMWSLELFKELHRHSATTANGSTYSAAGWVRRNLISAGFLVEKVKGYGKKREMLRFLHKERSSTMEEIS